MKILLLSRFFPYIGGREVLVMLLANELSKDNQVVLATPDVGRVAKDFEIIKNDRESLENCFKSFKPDIIHSHTFYLTPDIIKLAKKYKVPVILTIHGDILGFGSETDKKMFSLMVPKLDHLVTVCEQGKNQMLNNGLSKNKVSNIYPGIESNMFRATDIDKGIFRNSFQLPLNKFIFITPARMAKYKGLEILLEAVSKLDVQTRNRAIFWITTPATRYRDDELIYTKEILQKINDLGIKENMFISFTDFSSMSFAYKAADGFILPSTTEQFPVTILEAMNSKLPIIATNVGGVTEVVNQKTGYLIPPKNPEVLRSAIKFVINNDNNKKTTFAQNLVVKKFNITKMKDEYIGLYNRIVGGYD